MIPSQPHLPTHPSGVRTHLTKDKANHSKYFLMFKDSSPVIHLAEPKRGGCEGALKVEVENNFMYNDNTLFLCHSLYLLYIIINANKNYVGAVLVHLIRIFVNFLMMIFFFFSTSLYMSARPM